MVLAPRLQKYHELGDVVDRRRQSKTEDRNTATTIGFDRVHHRCVEDADWPVDLVDHHVPKVCVRSFLALEVGVHGGREREGHGRVVANDLTTLPRVPT